MSGTRICPRCNGLFDVANWVCPHCGEEFAPPRVVQPSLFDRWFRETGSTTKAIVAWIAIAFVVQLSLCGKGGLDFDEWKVVLLGGFFGPFADAGQYWRLVTAGFLHGGLIHIGFNLFWFYRLGPMVEQTFGKAKMVAVFFACVVTGSLAVWGFAPEAPAIGASGGVVGFIGVLAVWGHRQGGEIGRQIKGSMLRSALMILLFGLIIPGISNAGHIGGFLGGAALAFVVTPAGFRVESAYRHRLWDFAALATIVVVLTCCGFAGYRFQTGSSIPPLREPQHDQRMSVDRNEDAGIIRRALNSVIDSYARPVHDWNGEWSEAQTRRLEAAEKMVSDAQRDKSSKRVWRTTAAIARQIVEVRLAAFRTAVEANDPVALDDTRMRDSASQLIVKINLLSDADRE